VLNFKSRRYECLGCQTVRTPLHEPRTDATSQGGWNVGTHDEDSVRAWCASVYRARVFKMLNWST